MPAFTHSHTHSYTDGSNLGLSVLLKDTLTCDRRSRGSNHPLSHSRPTKLWSLQRFSNTRSNRVSLPRLTPLVCGYRLRLKKPGSQLTHHCSIPPLCGSWSDAQFRLTLADLSCSLWYLGKFTLQQPRPMLPNMLLSSSSKSFLL